MSLISSHFTLSKSDEIGVQIEEPLGILPLEDICNDIQGEVDAMIDRQDIVTGERVCLRQKPVPGVLCASKGGSDVRQDERREREVGLCY